MNWKDARDSLLSAAPVPPQLALSVSKPGMYAWWDLDGALDPWRPEGCPSFDWSRPVYVGKAEKSIGGRFERMHLAGTRQSSIRRSLAALLWKELDLLTGATSVGKGKVVLAAEQEGRLTAWMLANLHVTCVPQASPNDVEQAIIDDVSPLLNDTHAKKSPYRLSIRLARARLCVMAMTSASA